MSSDPWQSLFCDLLCKIYIRLGAPNCDDLGCDSDADEASYTVIDKYDNDGIPSGMTNPEKCDMLGELNDLENTLAEPGNTLRAQTTTDLNSMITSMRTDIGPVPGCPN